MIGALSPLPLTLTGTNGDDGVLTVSDISVSVQSSGRSPVLQMVICCVAVASGHSSWLNDDGVTTMFCSASTVIVSGTITNGSSGSFDSTHRLAV